MRWRFHMNLCSEMRNKTLDFKKKKCEGTPLTPSLKLTVSVVQMRALSIK